MRLVIGITGSSGILYGIRMLEALKQNNIEIHLIMTEWAKKCLVLETEYDFNHVKSLAIIILMILTWLQVFQVEAIKQME